MPDPTPKPPAAVAALIAAGQHLEAAQLCVKTGDLRGAIALFEKLWRFADALPLALRLGDRPLAVRLALDMGAPETANGLAWEIPGDAPGELHRASEAFAGRGRVFDGAVHAERAGAWLRAAALYERAGAPLLAARALELGGDLHATGVLLEGLVELGGDADDVARARLALGRLLARLGRVEDAARTLQLAARQPVTRLPAQRLLCAVLLRLGWRGAAHEIARRLREDAPDLPDSPDAIALAELPEERETPGASGLLARRFQVGRLIGAGATGRVYEAEDALAGRRVAVKLLAVGPGGVGPERQAYLRFAREAEAAGRMRHPNIVALLDHNESAGMFVLELMTETLADRLGRQGALLPPLVRRLALDVLGGLGAVHAVGIIHRDIKPANLFFDPVDNTKIGDFGSAHLIDFGQTQTGGFIGTVAYMPPEQLTGQAIGPPADVYALGVTLFEALTGRRPFLGPDLVAQHLGEEPPLPSALQPDLGTVYDATVLRALRKDPAERFLTADDMAEAIRLWPATDSTRREPGAARAAASADDMSLVAGQAAWRAELGRRVGGRLMLERDERVGRLVLVEERDEPPGDEDLAALRRRAAAGGPHIQRVLAIADGGRRVIYEALVGVPVTAGGLRPPEEAALAQARRDLAAAGIPAGDQPPGLVRTPGGLVMAWVWDPGAPAVLPPPTAPPPGSPA